MARVREISALDVCTASLPYLTAVHPRGGCDSPGAVSIQNHFLTLTLVLCVQLRPAMYRGGVPVGMHCTSCVPPVFLPRSMTTHLLFLPRLSSPSLSLSLSLSLSPFLLLILRSPNCTPTTPLNTKVAIWNVSPQGQVCIGVVRVCVCICINIYIYTYILW